MSPLFSGKPNLSGPSENPCVHRTRLEGQALRALADARRELLGSHPFLANLALRMELIPVWDSRCPTASTDGKHVYFRPDWMLAQNETDRVFVLAHEVGHCALGHFRRELSGPHELWNLAFDHEVNDLLMRDGLAAPEGCVHFRMFPEHSAEQVFDFLQDEPFSGQKGFDVHP